MVHHLTLLCHAMQCHTTFWFPRLPCWLSCGSAAAVTKPWAPHVLFLENKGKGILIATLLPVLGLQIYYTIVMVYFFSSNLTSLLMLSSLICLFFLLLQWMPFFVVCFSSIMAFIVPDSINFLPTLVSGMYVSWLYLRYFQRNPLTGLRGDPSDDFSFPSLFPAAMR